MPTEATKKDYLDVSKLSEDHQEVARAVVFIIDQPGTTKEVTEYCKEFNSGINNSIGFCQKVNHLYRKTIEQALRG